MGILEPRQKKQLQIFKEELLKSNKKINLVSRKDTEKQIERLIKNSIRAGQKLQNFFREPHHKVLDIGSGNGFPGLLFAILFPDQEFYLCEKKHKKAQTLKGMVYKMGMPQVQILWGPAEKLEPGFDRILSQASMPIKQLLPLSHKLLKLKGLAFLWLSQKDKPSPFPGLKMESLPSDSPLKSLLKLKKTAGPI